MVDMVPKTRRECPAESASSVAVPWDLLLDALLKTLHFPRINEEVVALLRRLPPLPADLSAGDIGHLFINQTVIRRQALRKVRRYGMPGGAFAMIRYMLNPHLARDLQFMRPSAHFVALGQDDGSHVLSFIPRNRDLFVESRDTHWSPGTAFLLLKNPGE